MPLISVVAPVYGSKECLEKLLTELNKYLSQITDTYEIILVDDRCPHGSWEKLKRLSENNENIKFIRLSKNFGQHYAITAGIDHAKGDWLFIIDADLEDHPKFFPRLYAKAQEGWDIVFASRKNRKRSWIKKTVSFIFHKLFSLISNDSRITGQKTRHEIANYTLISRKVYTNIKHYRENLRTYPFLLSAVGFNSTVVEIEHTTRYAGSSAYSFRRSLRLAIHSIFAYSDYLLKLMTLTGLGIASTSFISAIYFAYKKITVGYAIAGWTSLIVAIFFSTGLLMLSLGILGIYIGYIFNETKKRPLYIVDELIDKTK